METPYREAVDHALRRAEAYAEKLLEGLRVNLDADPSEASSADRFEAMARLKIKIKTQHLFPELEGAPCALLVTLYWQRQALTRLVSVSHQDIPLALRTQTERVTASLEQVFMQLAHETKKVIRFESLSPLAQTLIEQEYLCVSFPPPSA